MAIVQDTAWKDRWNAERSRQLQADREANEAQRKIDVEDARTTAQELGARLMSMRNAKFSGEYAGRNPEWVTDPDIDVLELRYRAAIRTLEELDRE